MEEKELNELSNKIIKNVGTNDASQSEIIIDGIQYALEEVEEGDWDDQGKFSNGYNVYKVGIADKEHTYKIAEPLDIFLYQNATRYGDYYQGYETEYEELYRVKKVEKKIIVTNWESI